MLNVRQNRKLNTAFAVTCFAWVLLWLPHEVLGIFVKLEQQERELGDRGTAHSVTLEAAELLTHDLKLMYSLANPIVLISPPFQELLNSLIQVENNQN